MSGNHKVLKKDLALDLQHLLCISKITSLHFWDVFSVISIFFIELLNIENCHLKKGKSTFYQI